MKLSFPANASRYYDTYCCSVLVDFQIAGADIKIEGGLNYYVPAVYEIKINDKKALIDLSDFYDHYNWGYDNKELFRLNTIMYPIDDLDIPIFKRQMLPGIEYPKNVFPLGPYFIADKSTPKTTGDFLEYGNIYNPFNSNRVISTNRVYAQNVLTRGRALNQLKANKIYSDISIDTRRVDQQTFWNNHGNCLTSICIPGASPYTQDNAPIEAVVLGVCIISGDMSFRLPYNKLFEKNKHFICLNSDYSDINEKINYIYDNRQEAKDIGEAAREIIKETSFPIPRANWVAQVVEEYYGK